MTNENNTVFNPTQQLLRLDVEKRVRKCYNEAGLVMILQFVIASAISSVFTFCYSFFAAFGPAFNAALAGETVDPAELATQISGAMSPTFLLVSTVVSYLIANLISYFIGNSMIKKHYKASLFGKISVTPFDGVLFGLAIIGIQMVSLIIQSIMIQITGMNGVSEEVLQMMSLSDDIPRNLLIVLYTVVIAAVTEELLCRGIILRAFSPVSKTFALFASSIMFGIMHGNFNQMFNGFLIGLVIGYAAIKSRSLKLPIILHMVANGHAMLLSFLEYKLGEGFLLIENLYIIVMAVIGIGAAILLIIRLGRVNEETDGFPCSEPFWGFSKFEDRRGLTYKALIKTPCFWIFTAIYFLTAIISVVPVAL